MLTAHPHTAITFLEEDAMLAILEHHQRRSVHVAAATAAAVIWSTTIGSNLIRTIEVRIRWDLDANDPFGWRAEAGSCGARR